MTRQRRQAIIAGACALVAVLAVFAYTASVRAEAASARESAISRYGGEVAEVLVATEDVSVGEALDESNAEVESWLVDLLPDGDVLESLDEAEGLVAKVDLVAGEVVVASRMSGPTSRITVPDGLVAVTVSSDDVLAVGGAIQEGSFVDVYVEDSAGSVTLMGEQIVVLETSTDDDDGDDLAWVTLAVEGDGVADLMSASAQGTIHFALPGSTDSEDSEDSGDSGDADDSGDSGDSEEDASGAAGFGYASAGAGSDAGSDAGGEGSGR